MSSVAQKATTSEQTKLTPGKPVKRELGSDSVAVTRELRRASVSVMSELWGGLWSELLTGFLGRLWRRLLAELWGRLWSRLRGWGSRAGVDSGAWMDSVVGSGTGVDSGAGANTGAGSGAGADTGLCSEPTLDLAMLGLLNLKD